MILGDFQSDVVYRTVDAWNGGAQNVMIVVPTGGGKTVIFTYVLAMLGTPACAIAHRQELVSQMALAFNKQGVPHGIIAPAKVIHQIVQLEVYWHGRSYYTPNAAIRVAGIDTLAKMTPDRWTESVKTVVQDEGHHVLKKNKWGSTQLRLFPTARGLYATAHAVRADGRGLGRNADGLVDHLIVGPCGRDLIYRGFLTDYRIRCPPSDLDLSQVPIGDSGEYEQVGLRAAHHKSKSLIGNVVDHYVEREGGKLGFTFAVDIESAEDFLRAYAKKHVHAQLISAHTPITVRGQIMQRFRDRDILQLVSVDTLGEGVDVPAVEVVSMGRATASWQVMCQQSGRKDRVSVSKEHMKQWHGYTDTQRLQLIAESSKPFGVLHDHVGNIARHYETRKFPCSRQTYSLDRAEKRSRGKSDGIPLTTCLSCFEPYERVASSCPHCGTPRPAPVGRTIEVVDGCLADVDPAWLAALHAQIAEIRGTAPPAGRDVISRSIAKRHDERYEMHMALCAQIALWAGYWRHTGLNDDEIQRMFYFRFGMDIATAQTLNQAPAAQLQARIVTELAKLNVRAA